MFNSVSEIYVRFVPGVTLEQFFLMYLESRKQLQLVQVDDPLARMAFWILKRDATKMTTEEAELLFTRLFEDDLIQRHISKDAKSLVHQLDQEGEDTVWYEDIFQILKAKKKTLQDYERQSEVQKRVRRVFSMTFSDLDLASSWAFSVYHCKCWPSCGHYCMQLSECAKDCFHACCGVM